MISMDSSVGTFAARPPLVVGPPKRMPRSMPPVGVGKYADTPEKRAGLVLAASVRQAAIKHFSDSRPNNSGRLGFLAPNGNGGGSSWGDFQLPDIDTSGYNPGGGSGWENLPYTNDPFASWSGPGGTPSFNPGANVSVPTVQPSNSGTNWASIVHDITTQVVTPLINRGNRAPVYNADGTINTSGNNVVNAGAAAGAVAGDAVSTAAGFVGRNVIPLGIAGLLVVLFMSGRKR